MINRFTLNRLLAQQNLGHVTRGATPDLRKLREAFDAAARKTNPRFRFVLIEHESINGVAHDGLFSSCVGFTTGAAEILGWLHGLLARSNQLFLEMEESGPQQGLPEQIGETFRICNGRPSIATESGADSYVEFLRGKPSNPSRAELAYSHYKYSALFLFFHELAHLARGHHGLLFAGEGPGILLEARGQACTDSQIQSKSQWAELEADWLAAVWMMQNQHWSLNEKEREDEAFALFYACGVVLLVFFQAFHGNGTHPHPCVRLAQILNNAPRFMRDSKYLSFGNVDFVEKACERAILEIAVTARLGGFEWFAEAERQVANLSATVERLNQAAGPEWDVRASARMERVILNHPSC